MASGELDLQKAIIDSASELPNKLAMATPWIESHTVLMRHRKVADLARALDIRKSYVIGHLHALWHAAMEQREDGDLSSWSDEFIAECSDYPGDAPQYVRLLQEHGFLDGKLLHDWLDYAGLYLTRKYASANRAHLEEIWGTHGRTYGPKGKQTNSERKVNLPVPTSTNQPTNQRKESARARNASSGGESEGLRDEKKDKNELAKRFIDHICQLSGARFMKVESNLAPIRARLDEVKWDVNGVFKMLDRQWKLWRGTNTEEFFRPLTLFRQANFHNYFGTKDQEIPSVLEQQIEQLDAKIVTSPANRKTVYFDPTHTPQDREELCEMIERRKSLKAKLKDRKGLHN